MSLGVEPHYRVARFPGHPKQKSHKSAAHAAVTPRDEHRHAADVAIGQQPAGADRRAISGYCEDVTTACVLLIPLQLLWDVLLLHEDLPAHGTQGLPGAVPVDGLDAIRSRLAHRPDYS